MGRCIVCKSHWIKDPKVICRKCINKTKVCTKCKKELPLTEFHIDRAKHDGLKAMCKECYLKVCSEYRRKYKESMVNIRKKLEESE